jgi:hypothetical protein
VAGIGSAQVLAASALATLALGMGLALNSWLKDRKNEDEGTQRREDVRYGELKDEVTSLRIAMVGSPPDPKRGIPGVDGFVQEQRRHNKRVDTELATSNSGGTLKGSLIAMRSDLTAVQESMDGLSDQVANLVRNGDK